MNVTYEAKRMVRLFERQGGRCPYTGLPLRPFVSVSCVSFDHYVPRVLGGSDAEDNIRLVPTWVNEMKGSMSAPQFAEWLRANGFPTAPRPVRARAVLAAIALAAIVIAAAAGAV